jgi:cyclic pyranopterin monophosphate synthase
VHAAGSRARLAPDYDHGRETPVGPHRGVWHELVSELSHVDESGGVRMVDVGGKPVSRRRAVARATVAMAPATAERLRALPKGDALVTAQLAGVMAAKRTSDLIPLCHPLPLSLVDVAVVVRGDGVEITAVAETTAQTGVEMEALVAASVAALTIYDMAKAIDKAMIVTEVSLVEKTKTHA